MKVKCLHALEDGDLEYHINQFLDENKDSIDVVDIKYAASINYNRSTGFYSAMIIYNEKTA